MRNTFDNNRSDSFQHDHQWRPKMPAYGHQIPPDDRWAIVLYIRGLQRSQNASLEDVPDDLRTTLREMN